MRKRDSSLIAFAVTATSCFWFMGAIIFLIGNGTADTLAIAAGIALGGLLAGAISGKVIDLGLVPAASLLVALFCLASFILTAMGALYPSVVSVLLKGGIGAAIGLALVPLNACLHVKRGGQGRTQATANFLNVAAALLAWGSIRLLNNPLHLTAKGIFLLMGIGAAGCTAWAAALLPDITVRFILRTTLASLMRVRVTGSENIPATGGVLLVSNHISYADSVVMGSATPRIPRFLIWQPIFDTPGVNFFFRVLHAIPIATESPKSTIQALRKARAVLESGEVVAIFPEGAISRSGDVEPFLRGFERIVDGLDVPIIPMHIDGLWGHPLSLKGGKLWGSWERAWWPVVNVRVGSPIYGSISPADLRDIVVELAGQQEADYAIR